MPHRMALGANETVGGQAVMEGVMIRSKNRLSIAVRKPGGEILVHTRPWYTLTEAGWLKKPFLRGFPILVETMVNGISALNFSAREALDESEGELSPWAMTLTVAAAVGGLFSTTTGAVTTMGVLVELVSPCVSVTVSVAV